jgi:ribonuclease HI
MYFNIHVNVLENGTKAVIISLNSHQYPISISLQFECTNNMVEYETYTRGFEAP